LAVFAGSTLTLDTRDTKKPTGPNTIPTMLTTVTTPITLTIPTTTKWADGQRVVSGIKLFLQFNVKLRPKQGTYGSLQRKTIL